MSTPKDPATSRGTRRARTGRAYLSEDAENRGRFGGSWQTDDAALENLDPPTDEQTALTWARSRAEIVAIRTVESMLYSAGDVNPWDAPQWPGLEQARANPHMTPPPD